MNAIVKSKSITSKTAIVSDIAQPATIPTAEALAEAIKSSGLVPAPAYATVPSITDTVILDHFDFVKGGKLSPLVKFDGLTWSITDFTVTADGIVTTLLNKKENETRVVTVDPRLLLLRSLYEGGIAQVLAGQFIEKAWSGDYPQSVYPFPVISQKYRDDIATANAKVAAEYTSNVTFLVEQLLTLAENLVSNLTPEQLVGLWTVAYDNNLVVIKAGINAGKFKSLYPIDSPALQLVKEGMNEDTGEQYYIYGAADQVGA